MRKITKKEYWKTWYLENKERESSRKRKWYQRNKKRLSLKREKNKVEKNTYLKGRYLSLKKRLFEFLGNKCAICGFSNIFALQLDHINGGGNRERKKLKSATSIYLKALKHPENYQILCANCNWIKRGINNEN